MTMNRFFTVVFSLFQKIDRDTFMAVEFLEKSRRSLIYLENVTR